MTDLDQRRSEASTVKRTWQRAWMLLQSPPQHKYAIDSRYLGDSSRLAWSNLGYWDGLTLDYVQACQQLADRLAQAVQLKSQDRLLDLGCGQGASLQHWQQSYAVNDLCAVELQQACVAQIQQHLSPCPRIDHASFYNLAALQHAQKFDVVLCIDAAYHGPIEAFLVSTRSVLKPDARLGFHCLIWTEKFDQLSKLQQQRYKYLLKAADVEINDLLKRGQLRQKLEQQGFGQIEIEDLSTAVFAGFANYVEHLKPPPFQHRLSFDYAKITMTAKLCRHLYREGVIHYVQVSATYGA